MTRRSRCLFPSFVLAMTLLVVAVSSGAQTLPLIWQHCYGGDSLDAFTCIKPTPDGGLIGAGVTRSADGDLAANSGLKGLWVVKLDGAGSIQWEKTYNDSIMGANYIEPTFDGGYIVTGTQTLKLDAAGNMQWADNLYGMVVHQAPDSGYILATNYYLVKLTSAGDTQWVRLYTPAGDHVTVADVCPAVNNGGYIITGAIYDIYSSPYVAYADNTGAVTFNDNYQHGAGEHVCQTANGQYLYLLGGRGGYSVQKLDTALNVIWQRGPISVGEIDCISPTSDYGFITWGESGLSNNDMTLTKYDSAGNQQWVRYLEGSRGDVSNFAFQTTGGNYVLSGWVNANDSEINGLHAGEDAWAALLGYNTAVPIVKNSAEVKIYPVPATNAVYVDMPEGYNNASLSLSDISGNIVAADNNTSLHRSIDLSHLATGTYLLTITNNGARSSYKVTHY